MAALPAGWTENLDPGSGKNFYYNASTGETSWDRPAGAAPAAGELPAGWAAALDPGSGNTFYHNAATGETSWERPAAAAPAAAGPGALPAGWAEHADPGSGRSFFANAATGETAWERPGGAAAALPAPAAAAGAIPEGWAEHSDPGSGRTFFYKAATGETSWERPVAATTGTWSTSQAHDLGGDPNIYALQERAEILSTKTGGVWSSVSRAVDALNDKTLSGEKGFVILYSASKDSYWLLWRSDKEKESESITAGYR